MFSHPGKEKWRVRKPMSVQKSVFTRQKWITKTSLQRWPNENRVKPPEPKVKIAEHKMFPKKSGKKKRARNAPPKAQMRRKVKTKKTSKRNSKQREKETGRKTKGLQEWAQKVQTKKEEKEFKGTQQKFQL